MYDVNQANIAEIFCGVMRQSLTFVFRKFRKGHTNNRCMFERCENVHVQNVQKGVQKGTYK